MENSGNDIFWAFLLLFCVLCAWGVLVLLASFLRTRLGLLWCASCWARLSGVVRRGHYLCNHWRESQAAHKIACFHCWFYDYFIGGKPYMLALVGRPSLHGNDACMFFWLLGHFGEIAGKKSVRPLFLLHEFFCLVGILGTGFGV